MQQEIPDPSLWAHTLATIGSTNALLSICLEALAIDLVRGLLRRPPTGVASSWYPSILGVQSMSSSEGFGWRGWRGWCGVRTAKGKGEVRTA